jgi:TolB-like protein/DNA-binding winged helix-turn-helix (wHTH) protein
LSPRAFDTLLYLVEHPNELIDKQTLMRAVWPDAIVEENNLNRHILSVRRALGETPDDHRFVVTVQGRGFQFVAPVKHGRATSRPGTADTITPPNPHETSRRALRSWALVVPALVLAAGLVWSFVHPAAQGAGPAVAVASPGKPRLAVLPFQTLSEDSASTVLTDGLYEEIVSTLAERIPAVDVVSRTTMMSYRAGPPKSIAVIARELGASYVMEGSVRREAKRIRLTLQLIDARNDGHLWSASYDRTLTDELTLETQVADVVAEQVSTAVAHHPRMALR